MLAGPSRAKWLLMTGTPIDANRALAWGLVDDVVAPEELDAVAGALAAAIATAPPDALAMIKQTVDGFWHGAVQAGMRAELLGMVALSAARPTRRGSPADVPRVGLYFDLRNPPAWEVPWAQHYARALETMEQAEALGASALWLTEHHFFADGYLPQPLTMAAAVAARTTRVRIGTAVYLPLLRNPVQVAEEAAIVDILSGGRLDLGIGVGYQPAEFAAFGARMNRRFADLESHVGALRSPAGPVTPKPIQVTAPVVGGFSRAPRGPPGRRGSRSPRRQTRPARSLPSRAHRGRA